MKGGQNLRDLQQKRKEKEEEHWVSPQECRICRKMLPGAYGHTTLNEGVVWSCSGVCEKKVQQLKRSESHAMSSLQGTDGDAVGDS